MIAWAGALQYHMYTVKRSPEYQEKFKDTKPLPFAKLLFGPFRKE